MNEESRSFSLFANHFPNCYFPSHKCHLILNVGNNYNAIMGKLPQHVWDSATLLLLYVEITWEGLLAI
jgi:hypothetical protein